LGSGERNSAKPKVAWRPSERVRASQRRGEGKLNLTDILASDSLILNSDFHPHIAVARFPTFSNQFQPIPATPLPLYTYDE
jgi:hypothetical protein